MLSAHVHEFVWYTRRHVTPHGISALLLAQDGGTPLMWAALKGHTEVSAYLLENGSNIEEEANVSGLSAVL